MSAWTNGVIRLKTEKFGTNLASLANMLSLIHRNLYRGLPQSLSRIDVRHLGQSVELVHEWRAHCQSNRVKALSLPSSQDS